MSGTRITKDTFPRLHSIIFPDNPKGVAIMLGSSGTTPAPPDPPTLTRHPCESVVPHFRWRSFPDEGSYKTWHKHCQDGGNQDPNDCFDLIVISEPLNPHIAHVSPRLAPIADPHYSCLTAVSNALSDGLEALDLLRELNDLACSNGLSDTLIRSRFEDFCRRRVEPILERHKIQRRPH